jgi:hypothetical protein
LFSQAAKLSAVVAEFQKYMFHAESQVTDYRTAMDQRPVNVERKALEDYVRLVSGDNAVVLSTVPPQ